MMIITLCLILIDQIIKTFVVNSEASFVLIPKILSFTYTQNFGAVFGSFQGSNNILAVISIIVCIVITIYIIKESKEKKSKSILLYIILAGGIGNVIDRIFRGFVVDYIDTPFIATFNFADSCIVVGIILLLIKELKEILSSEKSDRANR